MQTEPEGAQDQPLDLIRLAALPTERVLISAALGADGRLEHVGGMHPQGKPALVDGPHVHALAVSDTQSEFKARSALPKGKHVLKAASLDELVLKLDAELGEALYGSFEDLPAVLRQQLVHDSDGLLYDYRSASYHPRQRLDDLLAQAIEQHSKGYIYVLGTPNSGKTSWALNRMRSSQALRAGAEQREGSVVLDGWYFARRYGVRGDGDADAGVKRDEYEALQTLVSLARRHRDVVPAPDTRELLTEAQQRRHSAQFDRGETDTGKILREAFAHALAELARKASARHPLVLLIDGADEMWAPGGTTSYVRCAFPDILPTTADLPEHCYLILTSRPGDHMIWAGDHRPILEYQFPKVDVDQEVRGYLDGLAERHVGEAADILRNPRFQGNVCEACESAFGYVPLLMRDWVKSPVDHGLEQLRQWRDRPGALPKGIYGLRARELLNAEAQAGDASHTLSEVLALLVQLRLPLAQADFLDLMCGEVVVSRRPSQERRQLTEVLQAGRQFLERPQRGAARTLLRFGHQSLAETALAACRLRFSQHEQPDPGEVSAEARWLAGEAESLGVLSPQQRAQADTLLHLELAKACQRWWQDDQVKPAVGPKDDVSDARAYALMWGPWHALTAAATLKDDGKARALARRARKLLLNAGFLQSAIRAASQLARRRHEQPDSEFLRLTYIEANRIQADDPDRLLRLRIEANLLHWFEHIAAGQLQVGVMCWNLLAGWEPARRLGEGWKQSLDQEAWVTLAGGQPGSLVRRWSGYESALSPCGKWLVTAERSRPLSHFSRLLVWDLRHGAHRARLHVKLDRTCRSVRIVSAMGHLLVAGASREREGSVDVIRIDKGTAAWVGARYAGHTEWVSSVALHCEGDRIVVATDARDGTVGLLSLTDEEVRLRAGQADGGSPTEGRIARYAGHTAGVSFEALHCEGNRIVIATTFRDGTVGLLSLTDEEVRLHARQADGGSPTQGRIALYTGHTARASSVALHCKGDRIVVATGSSDGTVVLGHLTHEEVRMEAPSSPTRGRIARYAGHKGKVSSLALHCEGDRIVVTTRAWDGTVGLLSLTDEEVRLHAGQADGGSPTQIARYAGHGVTCVALHCEGNRIVVASGSKDGTVGLLSLTDEEVRLRAGQADGGSPSEGQIAHYAGHENELFTVALHCEGDQTLVATGSEDRAVSLLSLAQEELREPRAEDKSWFGQRFTRSVRWSGSRVLALRKDGLLLASKAERESGVTLMIEAVVPLDWGSCWIHDIVATADGFLIAAGLEGADVGIVLLEPIRPGSASTPLPRLAD